MRKFLDDDFMLFNETGKTLYKTSAEGLPIIDYHCHINPQEIYENKQYENIAQLWLGVGGSHFGDHYKWRFMRSCGVDEYYITGTAPDEERFQKWADCLELAVGNPLYHWSHMELKTYFDYSGDLNSANAAEVYRFCNEKIKAGGLSVRQIIQKSNVKLICTTDDPVDTLEWHLKLRNDPSFPVQVLPAMRPDKAKAIEKPGYTEYLAKLSSASGVDIRSFSDLKTAIRNRMDYFQSVGCRVSDHALEYVMCSCAPDEEIEMIFSRRLSGEALSRTDIDRFYTAFMLFVGEEYARRGWVMQLHYGAKRDNNTKMYEKLGPDTGYDCISNYAPSAQLADFLNTLEKAGALPKTIIYSLNPNDNDVISSILGCFQNSEAVSKLQLGSAWWFNDHVRGMTDQLRSLANAGALAGFVGMLTDSRSFLSYTRHDYFRRILCQVIGSWVEDGLYPCNSQVLDRVIKGICFNNAVKYFGFDLEQV